MGGSSDGERLERALAVADIRYLLMLLVQLTGDRRRIEPPYRPVPAIGMFAPPDGRLDTVANSPWRLVDYWSMTHDVAATDWAFELSRP